MRLNNLILASLFFFLLPIEAYALVQPAYIDPGSGSAIMSAIIGAFVVVGIAIKSFWYKIKSFFVRGKKDDSNSTDAE